MNLIQKKTDGGILLTKMPILPAQTKKRLYTPAFQTPIKKENFMTLPPRKTGSRLAGQTGSRYATTLPKEDLDRIIRNTITRQLAREAARNRLNLKESLIGTGSVTGKPSALDYV